MAKQYIFENIRELLTEGFTDEQLRRFCYDTPKFRPVYNQLAQASGKTEIISQLIEYAEQQLLIEILLDWVKKVNPARYEKHQPYYEVATSTTVSALEKEPDAIEEWIIKGRNKETPGPEVLLDCLEKRFLPQDLKKLYFLMNLGYDDLAGGSVGRAEKAMALINYAKARGRLPELFNKMRETVSGLEC
jgi:hypothetical protein